MKNHTKFSALVSTILLSVALAGPANAAPPELSKPAVAVQTETSVISAASTARISYVKTAVATTPAPVAPAAVAGPAPVEIRTQSAPTQTLSTPTPNLATQPLKAASTVAVTASAPAPAPAVSVGSGRGAALLASAYAQIGITQDCTRMVENALASIGIISGDLAPAQFFRFGTVVGTPAPGDILISAGHVGIYAGNGQMVSGGFNGSQTVLHPVSYVGAFSAVRVA